MIKYINYFIFSCITAAFLVSQSACKKEKTTWDTSLKVPLAQTELKVVNLLSSDQVQSDPDDGSLKIVFENELANIILSDVYKLPSETIEFGSSLQSLELPDDSTVQSVTLTELAEASGRGPLLAFLEGQTVVLPAMSNIPVEPFNIDNSSIYQTVDLQSGTMEVTITNGLPVDIENLTIELRNSPSTGNDLIGITSFPLIPAYSTKTNIVVLDGKVVSSSLVADITSFNTAASDGPVLVRGADSIEAKVVLKDLVPNSATAIWPDQNLIDSTSLAFLAQDNGAMIKEMVVKNGAIDIEVFSSLQDSMFVSYSVPNLIKDGKSFSAEVALPPATNGGYSSKSVTFNFDGYDFKLNGYGIESSYGKDLNGNITIGESDTVNAYAQILTARMKYTGNMVPISLSDTVFIKAVIGNVTPEYVDGYMGKDTVEIGPNITDLEFFNNYLSGKLKLEDAKVSIVVENGIGADAQLQIESLSGTNTVNNSTVNLTGTGVVSAHNLGAATETGDTPPVNETSTSVELTSNNSNAADFLGNLPNTISYSLKTMINGNLTVPSYQDVVNSTTPINFLYDNTGVSAKINVEVPLSMVADNLTLVDTMDFKYSAEENTRFSNRVFTLIVENGFAFDATVNLILLNGDETELDTLMSNGFVKRGEVDVNSGKTISSTKSLIHFIVQEEEMIAIRSSTKIKATINLHSYEESDSNQKFHKMYSSDSFKLKVVGKAVYNINH